MLLKNKISLFILLIGHLLTILDIFIVNIAIPSIQNGLDATSAQMQLVVGMYMIGFASFLIIGGKAGDNYGRKSVFLLGMVLFMLISTWCGLAKTPEQLITLRFFQGVSAGLMSPQVLSYIQVLFKDHKVRTQAIGWYGIAIGIGTILGQFLGGFLVELKPWVLEQSWRYIFLINIPICTIAIVLGMIFLSQSKDQTSSKMDYKSASILSIGLIMFVSAVTLGLEQCNHQLMLLFPVSLIVIFLFIYIQRKEKDKAPLLNLDLFRYKNFNMAVFAVALFMVMLDAYFYILAVFLQDGLKLSPIHASYFIVFQGAGFILTSLFSARLVLKFGKKIMIFGVSMIIIALVLQLVLFYCNKIDYTAYAVMVIHGLGVALVLPSFANIALKELPEKMIGNASGVYSTLQQLFGALGITLTGGVFYYLLKGGSNFSSFYHSFMYTTFIHLLCLTVVLIVLIYLPNTILPKGKTE